MTCYRTTLLLDPKHEPTPARAYRLIEGRAFEPTFEEDLYRTPLVMLDEGIVGDAARGVGRLGSDALRGTARFGAGLAGDAARGTARFGAGLAGSAARGIGGAAKDLGVGAAKSVGRAGMGALGAVAKGAAGGLANVGRGLVGAKTGKGTGAHKVGSWARKNPGKALAIGAGALTGGLAAAPAGIAGAVGSALAASPAAMTAGGAAAGAAGGGALARGAEWLKNRRAAASAPGATGAATPATGAAAPPADGAAPGAPPAPATGAGEGAPATGGVAAAPGGAPAVPAGGAAPTTGGVSGFLRSRFTKAGKQAREVGRQTAEIGRLGQAARVSKLKGPGAGEPLRELSPEAQARGATAGTKSSLSQRARSAKPQPAQAPIDPALLQQMKAGREAQQAQQATSEPSAGAKIALRTRATGADPEATAKAQQLMRRMKHVAGKGREIATTGPGAAPITPEKIERARGEVKAAKSAVAAPGNVAAEREAKIATTPKAARKAATAQERQKRAEDPFHNPNASMALLPGGAPKPPPPPGAPPSAPPSGPPQAPPAPPLAPAAAAPGDVAAAAARDADQAKAAADAAAKAAADKATKGAEAQKAAHAAAAGASAQTPRGQQKAGRRAAAKREVASRGLEKMGVMLPGRSNKPEPGAPAPKLVGASGEPMRSSPNKLILPGDSQFSPNPEKPAPKTLVMPPGVTDPRLKLKSTAKVLQPDAGGPPTGSPRPVAAPEPEAPATGGGGGGGAPEGGESEGPGRRRTTPGTREVSLNEKPREGEVVLRTHHGKKTIGPSDQHSDVTLDRTGRLRLLREFRLLSV